MSSTIQQKSANQIVLDWLKAFIPAIVAGAGIIWAINQQIIEIDRNVLSLQIQVKSIEKQMESGILPGAREAIDGLRSEFLIREVKTNAALTAQNARMGQFEDRLVNIAARLRKLEQAGP